MNDTNTNENLRPPATGSRGTSVTDSENPLTLLSDAYERLGLATGDAWDAATADYRAFRQRFAGC